MARPRPEGAPEPKRRSRFGCWPCKARKIKCGEEKPACQNCEKQGEKCDYSIKLNWEVKGPKKAHGTSASWSISGMNESRVSPSASRSQQGSPVASSRSKLAESPRRLASSGQISNRGIARAVSDSQIPISGLSSTSLRPDQILHTGYSPMPESLLQANRLSIDSTLANHSNTRPESFPHLAPNSSLQPHSIRDNWLPDDSEPEPSKKRIKIESTRGLNDDDFQIPFNMMSGDNRADPASTHQTSSTASLTSYLPQSPFSTTPALVKSNESRTPEDSRSWDDPRRLSIKSLLSKSDPTEGDEESDSSLPTLGFDQGRADLDLPRNDDTNALTAYSPSSTLRQLDSDRFPSPAHPNSTNGFGFGLQSKDNGNDTGGYYAEPVPIQIPRSLQPLPDLLKQNPMNLLYFHHFLNHTARILVPHDCPDNPFRSILPQLAVRNVNLLNLLLAYSASHRARLLKYHEPVNRIAIWVSEVFPNLRVALTESSKPMSDSNLATAIMLASLEIISPNAFEVPVTWQNHLAIAREMIIARGGYQTLSREDKTSYFLSRWFTYLDVLGSLSGSNYDRPLKDASETFDTNNISERDSEIDCFLGFTTFCIRILARVADLAKQCDSERVLPNGDIDPDWKPPSAISREAQRLIAKLEAPRSPVYRGCNHQSPSAAETSDGRRESNFANYSEMVATNEAFHQAGLIHLHRRVLNKPSQAMEVQLAVRAVVEALGRISEGGTAEACMIFPMFSAGCEAQTKAQQSIVLQRMRSVENLGMAQGRKARLLMQKVWETGKPWESLVTGEFFG